jgi:hypothetical protein
MLLKSLADAAVYLNTMAFSGELKDTGTTGPGDLEYWKSL